MRLRRLNYGPAQSRQCRLPDATLRSISPNQTKRLPTSRRRISEKNVIRKSLYGWFKFPVRAHKFPVPSQKFPVLLSREFCCKPLNSFKRWRARQKPMCCSLARLHRRKPTRTLLTWHFSPRRKRITYSTVFRQLRPSHLHLLMRKAGGRKLWSNRTDNGCA